ncbi:hypothetical protein PR048_013009 [Dryococelus australis]|uniref:Uncharacterized protein n=1 Tax=Dryococelus australis TaxID=614101 RepID=A0ABQ9HR09_9NEOP|nr:hypothetical protein PR048_013009 [Dryococelus australis]
MIVARNDERRQIELQRELRQAKDVKAHKFLNEDEYTAKKYLNAVVLCDDEQHVLFCTTLIKLTHIHTIPLYQRQLSCCGFAINNLGESKWEILSVE